VGNVSEWVIVGMYDAPPACAAMMIGHQKASASSRDRELVEGWRNAADAWRLRKRKIFFYRVYGSLAMRHTS
jgi:hypothetical protein